MFSAAWGRRMPPTLQLPPPQISRQLNLTPPQQRQHQAFPRATLLMPELTEVETMCRGIAQTVGRTIELVSKPACRYRPIAIKPRVSAIDRRLRGEKVTHISRLGKRVLLHTHEWALILQPKMTGLVATELPPDPEHVRLQIDFAGAPPLRLQFWDRRGLGTVELLRQKDINARIVDGRLGPDALALSLIHI